MDKGIRPAARAKFVELNEQRRRGLLTNTVFRKTVMAYIMEEFGTTLASAATHYNDAFKFIKELNSELVDGLGRPEDKKGGRKPKVRELPQTTEATGDEDLTEQAMLAVAGSIPNLENVDQVPNDSDTKVVITYTVKKAKDGVVVAEGLTEAEANALIARAVAQKKAKLVIA